MNEQTTKLIEQLARELGTTAEYLWTVLIRQAPISAVIDLVYLIIVSLMGIALYKVHLYLSKEGENNHYEESIYEDNPGVGFAMIFSAIIWGIFFIVCFFSITNIVNGFFHPEYWALKEVLNTLNQ